MKKLFSRINFHAPVSPSVLISRISDLLIICSGANLQLLNTKKCRYIRGKYIAIGLTIVLTAIFAGFSGGYSFYSVFESYWRSIVFGLIWGIVIFNFDRFLVLSATKEKEFSGRQLGISVIRIIVAIFISIVVVKPLELKLFERPIQAEMAKRNTEIIMQYEQKILDSSPELAQLQKRREEIESEVKRKEERRHIAYANAMAENDGVKGTLIPGKGAVFAEKWNEFKKLDQEYKDFQNLSRQELGNINQRITILKERIDEQITDIQNTSNNATDFLTSFTILNSLAEQNKTIGATSNAITLLFIIIDCSPLFAQLITKRDIYDVLLESHTKTKIAFLEKEMANNINLNHVNQNLEWEIHKQASQEIINTSEYQDLVHELVDKMLIKLRQQLIKNIDKYKFDRSDIQKTVQKVVQEHLEDIANTEVKAKMSERQIDNLTNDTVKELEKILRRNH